MEETKKSDQVKAISGEGNYILYETDTDGLTEDSMEKNYRSYFTPEFIGLRVKLPYKQLRINEDGTVSER